jgi:hypothetical protein
MAPNADRAPAYVSTFEGCSVYHRLLGQGYRPSHRAGARTGLCVMVPPGRAPMPGFALDGAQWGEP